MKYHRTNYQAPDTNDQAPHTNIVITFVYRSAQETPSTGKLLKLLQIDIDNLFLHHRKLHFSAIYI